MTDGSMTDGSCFSQLRAMLLVLLGQIEVRVCDRRASAGALHRLVRKAGRLAHRLMLMQVHAAHMRMKAKMLADTLWRRRVIAALGGLCGLQQWRRRFRAGVASRQTVSDQTPSRHNSTIRPHPSRPAGPTSTPIANLGQFRLPPLRRAFYGRADYGRHGYGGRPVLSPLHRPIVVTVDELLSAEATAPPPPPSLYYPNPVKPYIPLSTGSLEDPIPP
ncbi:hypothetical protein [Fretibacter rubidus]|uniref:hypothetical protein n=1 Tax=Fretibacter rubidus TaxID=570162 RepID=UPI00352B189B